MPLINCRLVPAVVMTRLINSSPSSQGSTPNPSSCALRSAASRTSKLPSTVQASSPARMSDLSARSPMSSFKAPTMIDLPEPVSPVTAVKPGPGDQLRSSTRARLRMRTVESRRGVTRQTYTGQGPLAQQRLSKWQRAFPILLRGLRAGGRRYRAVLPRGLEMRRWFRARGPCRVLWKARWFRVPRRR